ncbi:Pre-mRNA-splicing factor 18 [Balamuthia mandrillaris]
MKAASGGGLAALRAEIEKKRKLAAAKAGGAEPLQKRYKTKGEIEREREEEERRKQEERGSKGKGKATENGASTKEKASDRGAKANPKDKSNDTVSNKKEEEEEEDSWKVERQKPTLPKGEVIKRLRSLSQPITLFGETDLEREHRLLQLEALGPVEAEYKSGSKDEFGLDIKVMEEGDTIQLKPEEEEEEELPEEVDESTLCKEDAVLYLLKRLLREWEKDLSARSDDIKRVASGKVATATFKQTCRNIKPLFTLLRKRTLAGEILEPLAEIVSWIKNREYLKANDAYLRMAIGNAPWPMGVTMVGIHERSAREKIFSNQVAHVLNDETQRKYIQAVKRLISYAQNKWPNDPSKNIG